MDAWLTERLPARLRRHWGKHLLADQGLLPTERDPANNKLGKLLSYQLGNLISIERSTLA